MASGTVIDSHVHIWPEEMANEDLHAWMQPGMPLAKAQLLSHYRQAARHEQGSESDTVVEGVIYVETDVRYEEPHDDIATWAKGPLDEIRFLRRTMEGYYDVNDHRILAGLVLWAPMHQATLVLEEYLALAEEVAGHDTWSRVKGFRFLLQFIHDQEEFRRLVLGDAFIANLKTLGRHGFSFDVGVDQRSGGIWQLEVIVTAMGMAHRDVPEHERVTYIVNHLCKPDFQADRHGFKRWCDAISSMSKLSNTYMKLSGAFSELPSDLRDPGEIAAQMQPWIAHVLGRFGPARVMFGSDFPVLNVNGPLGGDSWVAWKDVVTIILAQEDNGLTDAERGLIWSGTAKGAYRIA